MTDIVDRPVETRPRRGKGRPIASGAAVGRQGLIIAAAELLIKLPPAKVTRAEVARHAGVDPALIRYYFHNRESLLLAVLKHTLEDRIEEVSSLSFDMPVEDRLRHLVSSTFHFGLAHPFLYRLLMEEIAVGDSCQAREMFRSVSQRGVALYAAIVDDGVRQGVFRPVTPVLLHIALIGLSEFFVRASPMIELGTGGPADLEALADEYAQLIGDMFVNALSVRT